MTAAPHSAQPVAYEEHVAAAGWFGVLARLLPIVPLIGIVASLRDPEIGSAGRAATIGGLLFTSAILVGVARWFVALDVTVTGEALRFRFGPFGRTLGASALRAARVREYPWLAFGGWGWRLGRLDGGSAQAYSVPFLREGVAVTTAEGRTYYISSRAPARLVEAIERLQHGAGAA
jgi:hypothetical protein